MTISSENKKFLLNLTKESIKCFLNTNRKIEIQKNQIPEELQKNGAVFVTLTINGELRGCIGHLKATRPLYQDVIENAMSSAFDDPRFNPLNVEEFKKIKIEISILSESAKLEYKDADELIDFLKKQRPGLIIKKGAHSATFLPQVWEELNEPEEFLSRLCLKAGLEASEWENGNLEIFFYKVEKIKED